jgi:hypothetical protein
MKTSLRLEEVTTTKAMVDIANIEVEMVSASYRSGSIVKVKLAVTPLAIRITSNHEISEMNMITRELPQKRVKQYAKTIIEAHNTLKDTLEVFTK